MADATRRVSVRLSLDDAARVKAGLREVGETGQRSLDQIKGGAERASRSLELLDVAVRGIQLAGVAVAARALVQAGDALTQSLSRLQNATGSVERAGQVYEALHRNALSAARRRCCAATARAGSQRPALIRSTASRPACWRGCSPPWQDRPTPSASGTGDANTAPAIRGATRAGIYERRYTANGVLSLAEGKIAITRKLAAAMAGALVVSGGRFFIHAGAPALPAATLTSDDLRGDVTIQGARPRRDLFNGVRAVYVEPAANWQPTDAPPLLASNYVAQDGGEMIYRDLEFPLTTSVSTVQRLMKVELERNRRQRTVAFPANLSALRLRPWEAATVALDRLTPFPARVTAWSLAAEGGVDLTLEEEDAAVWDWNPAVDERATGSNPAVVLPNPGVIAAPASIAVETPQATAFAVLSLSWAAVGSSHLAGYQVEFLPASVAAWQGYGGSLGATAAVLPTAEPTGFRVRAVARSGAVSGWRQALVPAAVAAPTATGISGGIRLSGGFPADAVRLQVFEASSNSLAAAVKLATEPTSLFWDRTGLSAGDTRWYWLRAVSAEGNVSALVGPVSTTAL